MRVLSISKSTGGLAVYNEQLVTRLVGVAGFDVEVACLSEGRQAYAARLRRAGLRAHEIEMMRYSIGLLADARTAAAIVGLLRRGDFDVVLGHGTKAGFLARVCGRLTGVPSVYKLASLAFERRTQGARAPVYKGLERLASRFGGTIVTVCDATREAVIAQRITTPERVRAIKTGVDPGTWAMLPDRADARAAFNLDPAAFTVGWAARMSEQKDPQRFLDALRLLQASVPGVCGVMAGDGPLRAAVERRVKSEGLPVKMLPWQENLKDLLAAVDALVLTSRWEGLPLTVLEAMAAGCPVVATPVDGTREVIRHRIDGLLASSPKEIAVCLEELCRDPRAAEALGRAARARVESSFNVDRMVGEWTEVLAAAGAFRD